VTAHALLVPDCGSGIGLGHLERMLALADALRPDVVASVVIPEGFEPLRTRVTGRGHAIVEAVGPTVARAESAARDTVHDVIVLDGYVFGVDAQRRLRALAPLIVVDDLGLPNASDIAVNPSPGGERKRPDGAGAFLGGARYALVSRAIVDARTVVSERGRPPRSVLVSTGSMNLRGISGQVSAELVARDATVDVSVVVGPEMHRDELPDNPRQHVLVAPQTLADALASSTVYAGAAGTTAVQAACVGIPAVITPAVANQSDQAAALAAAGCAVAAEPEDLAGQCLALLDDPARCDEMARRGRSLVDGSGASRVAEALRHLLRVRAA